MAERKMADALEELYNDGVKAKMKDFIIENIDTIVAQLAGKYLTQADAQSQFASINTALSGKLDTTATAASAATASKVTGGTIQLTGSVTGTGSFNSAGNVTINTSGGGTTYSTGTASTAGITKLYTSTGSSTDGTMTRQAITNELNNKATTAALNSLQSTVNNKANASDLSSLQTTVNSKANASDLANYAHLNATSTAGYIYLRTNDSTTYGLLQVGALDSYGYLEFQKYVSNSRAFRSWIALEEDVEIASGNGTKYYFKSDGIYKGSTKIAG